MGNILVTQDSLNKWMKESADSKRLMKITPRTKQEESDINECKKMSVVKFFMAFLLGTSFSISLNRYFPEATFIQNKFYFGLTSLCVILPALSLTMIYINQDVIDRLKCIETNHRIMDDEDF